MRIFYLILMILIAFFIVTFSQHNTQEVMISYFYLEPIVVPAYMLIFVALLIGVVITAFLGIVERFRLNRTITRLNKVIRDLRKEIRSQDIPPVIENPMKGPEIPKT